MRRPQSWRPPGAGAQGTRQTGHLSGSRKRTEVSVPVGGVHSPGPGATQPQVPCPSTESCAVTWLSHASLLPASPRTPGGICDSDTAAGWPAGVPAPAPAAAQGELPASAAGGWLSQGKPAATHRVSTSFLCFMRPFPLPEKKKKCIKADSCFPG